MTTDCVGILHPGAMGASVAATIRNSGYPVLWASEGRSPQTQQRAAVAGLRDVGSLAALCDACSVLVSVCPPHAAEAVADQVLACSFHGLYIDANAISPQCVQEIGRKMERAGISFVDGGIIGGSTSEPGQTWLYLSGARSTAAARLFSAGPLEAAVLGESVGRASALKMCYAAYTKGSTALLCAILATAQVLGVRHELEAQWSRDWPGFAQQTATRVQRVTAKAWRFAGEMDEIAATFRQAGMPGEFHGAAAEVYRRIAHLRGTPQPPPLSDVLAALAQPCEQDAGLHVSGAVGQP
jgi:3-hydroxyisobutyrate dehydrogenase-like beta-hydroxyacid dehydrogenase